MATSKDTALSVLKQNQALFVSLKDSLDATLALQQVHHNDLKVLITQQVEIVKQLRVEVTDHNIRLRSLERYLFIGVGLLLALEFISNIVSGAFR